MREGKRTLGAAVLLFRRPVDCHKRLSDSLPLSIRIEGSEEDWFPPRVRFTVFLNPEGIDRLEGSAVAWRFKCSQRMHQTKEPMHNIQVTHDVNLNNARSESSIVINPNNPMQMVAVSKKIK